MATTETDKKALALRMAKWMDEYAAGTTSPIWIDMGEASDIASILREYAESGLGTISTEPKPE